MEPGCRPSEPIGAGRALKSIERRRHSSTAQVENRNTERAADLAERLLDEVVRADHRWEVVQALAEHLVEVSERAMAGVA
jgi:hypothetical protein